MRAFRLDKMTLAALEATLRLYRDTARAMQDAPVLRMLSVPLEELKSRAETLAVRLRQIGGIASAIASEDRANVGGGSLPDRSMPTWVVRLKPQSCTETEMARRLRVCPQAVMSRDNEGLSCLICARFSLSKSTHSSRPSPRPAEQANRLHNTPSGETPAPN